MVLFIKIILLIIINVLTILVLFLTPSKESLNKKAYFTVISKNKDGIPISEISFELNQFTSFKYPKHDDVDTMEIRIMENGRRDEKED